MGDFHYGLLRRMELEAGDRQTDLRHRYRTLASQLRSSNRKSSTGSCGSWFRALKIRAWSPPNGLAIVASGVAEGLIYIVLSRLESGANIDRQTGFATLRTVSLKQAHKSQCLARSLDNGRRQTSLCSSQNSNLSYYPPLDGSMAVAT